MVMLQNATKNNQRWKAWHQLCCILILPPPPIKAIHCHLVLESCTATIKFTLLRKFALYIEQESPAEWNSGNNSVVPGILSLGAQHPTLKSHVKK